MTRRHEPYPDTLCRLYGRTGAPRPCEWLFPSPKCPPATPVRSSRCAGRLARRTRCPLYVWSISVTDGHDRTLIGYRDCERPPGYWSDLWHALPPESCRQSRDYCESK